MSTRERWIVYPLLFLALGAAIKPKLEALEAGAPGASTVDLDVDRIRCRALYVVGADNRPRIRMAPALTSGEGELQITDERGKAMVRLRAEAASRGGLIETLREDGSIQTAMMSNADGGEVVAFNNEQTKSIAIGHHHGTPGVFVTDIKTGETQPVAPAEE
jgi:hypothetical protein